MRRARFARLAALGMVPVIVGAEAPSGLRVDFAGSRRVFVRMEEEARTSVRVTNEDAGSAAGVTARITFQRLTIRRALGDLAPGASAEIEVPVDAALRPGDYPLAVTVAGGSAPEAAPAAERTISIVPRPVPRMPVVMWGGGDIPTLREIGFTHRLVWMIDYGRVWEAGETTEAMSPRAAAETRELLDDLLANGLAAAAYLYPGRWISRHDSLRLVYGRVDRGGEVHGDNVCAAFPEVRSYARDVGASVARTFGGHPGLQASLVHSEVRDGTRLCFHDHDAAAYRALSGREIPREAAGKGGVLYSSIPAFPANRIVADDDPLLAWYRWFWKDGDGWNPLHTQVHDGLKSTGREDLWTFFDPAVRAPGLWGSGGGVDVISQWTYSYPDPIKIGQAADELFAMAAGAEGQRVMKMTQAIWYRSGTAPELPADEADYAGWEAEQPEARFITIAPDHLREAFWSKLSRPVRGIMYHGWGSLTGGDHRSYRYTNPETRQVLGRLLRDVVQPLGPALLQVPDRPADVAVLHSFASQVYAGRGTNGWSGTWEADVHLVLQWAQLQPRILFDETILRDGLDGIRVLVLPYCDVLTESVAERIQRFQDRGGLLVADEHLAPRLSADILLPERRRSGRAAEDKAALQSLAAGLRRELDPFYTRYAESTNPDVIVRLRRHGDADYAFVVNDHRAYGDYVGHHGLVMEKGLPSTAELRLRRRVGGLYDLVAGAPAPFRRTPDGAAFDVAPGPGEGKVYLLLDRPIEAVAVTATPRSRLGGRVQVEVAVRDSLGPVGAVVPVRLDVLDPEGRQAEFSGWYGARDGRLSVRLDLAANDRPGRWTVRARELASGRTGESTFTVEDGG